MIAPSQLFSTSKRVLLVSGINFIAKNISTFPLAVEAMANSETFMAFQEEQYHKNKESNDFLAPFTKTLHDSSAAHVTEFILMMLHRGYFDVSEFIISVIYLIKFKEKSGIALHVSAWRPLFITSLLLADKMWEDKSVKNSSLTMLFPVLKNAELFELEVRFLEWLGFSAWVTRTDFQKFCESLIPVEAPAEISDQILKSDYVAQLQDGITEAPSVKPANARKAVGGKGAPVRQEQRQEQQPWNARKTLHAHSPAKRVGAGLSASPPSKSLSPGPQNGAGSDNESGFGSVSPRRKASPLQGASAPSLPRSAAPQLQHTNSVGTYSLSASQSPRRLPPGQQTSSLQQASTPVPNAHAQAYDRRTNSEPRVAPQATVVSGAQRLAAKGRPPPSVAGVQHVHQANVSAGQPGTLQSVTVPPASAVGGPRSTASPRTDNHGVATGSEQKPEVGGVMPSDRCSSEPAVLGRSVQQQRSVSSAATSRGPQGQCLPSQAVPHSRSASTVAQAKPPPPPAQRVAFPFGPTARSTVPFPGTNRTTRPGSKPVVPQAQRPAVPCSTPSNASGAHIASVVANAGLLGRGRSSSPAGIADGCHVPPPSARRNVAAPPPTMRPAGLRFGG